MLSNFMVAPVCFVNYEDFMARFVSYTADGEITDECPFRKANEQAPKKID
jgi:hypothetical protein